MSSQRIEKNKLPVFMCNGFPLPGGTWFTEQNMKDTMNYIPKDNDIVLCTYPKTGQTWLTYIIWQILHKGESYFNSLVDSTQYVPLMEMCGTSAVEALKKPRFYKHHLPCNLIQINPRAKYICIIRNAEDVVVSYYHMAKETAECTELEFDFFVDAFIKGEVPYGSYFDHLLSYESHGDNGYFLFVCYEELKKNTRAEILRIAKYLGEEYHHTLETDESVMDKIIEKTSFDYMKKNVDESIDSAAGRRKVYMFRKGITGDGRNHLSEEQIARLGNKMLEKLKGTVFANMWSH